MESEFTSRKQSAEKSEQRTRSILMVNGRIRDLVRRVLLHIYRPKWSLPCFKKTKPESLLKFVVLGLQGSGKTTFCKKFISNDPVKVENSKGLISYIFTEKMEIKRSWLRSKRYATIKYFEIESQKQFNPDMENDNIEENEEISQISKDEIYVDAHAYIIVVDANEDNFWTGESKLYFDSLLNNQYLKGKPLLIVGRKFMDEPCDLDLDTFMRLMNVDELEKRLKIATMFIDQNTDEKCIRDGMDWFVMGVLKNIDEIEEQINEGMNDQFRKFFNLDQLENEQKYEDNSFNLQDNNGITYATDGRSGDGTASLYNVFKHDDSVVSLLAPIPEEQSDEMEAFSDGEKKIDCDDQSKTSEQSNVIKDEMMQMHSPEKEEPEISCDGEKGEDIGKAFSPRSVQNGMAEFLQSFLIGTPFSNENEKPVRPMTSNPSWIEEINSSYSSASSFEQLNVVDQSEHKFDEDEHGNCPGNTKVIPFDGEPEHNSTSCEEPDMYSTPVCKEEACSCDTTLHCYDTAYHENGSGDLATPHVKARIIQDKHEPMPSGGRRPTYFIV